MEPEGAGTAISTLARIADDLDAAARWGADVRLPTGLEPVLRRLLAYAGVSPRGPYGEHADLVTSKRSPTTTHTAPGTSAMPGTDLVISIMRSEPGRVWTLDSLMAAMTERGWTTTGKSPKGVVANTIGKAMDRIPNIKRGERRGTYQWSVPDESSSNPEASGGVESPEMNPDTSVIEEKGATGEPVADHEGATLTP